MKGDLNNDQKIQTRNSITSNPVIMNGKRTRKARIPACKFRNQLQPAKV